MDKELVREVVTEMIENSETNKLNFDLERKVLLEYLKGRLRDIKISKSSKRTGIVCEGSNIRYERRKSRLEGQEAEIKKLIKIIEDGKFDKEFNV